MRAFHFKAKLAVAAAALAMISAPPAFPADQTSENPTELVRQTVQNEIAGGNGSRKAIFEDSKVTPHGSQTRLMVETSEGTAGILVAIDGKSLTLEQRQAEEARLYALMNNSEALKKKQRSEKDDADHSARIMKALPDAFLYQPDGTVPGTAAIGKPGDQLIRLKFRPDPKYIPPSHTEQVLSGMQGYLLIDAEQHRIAKIDGTLAKDVGFGWGILGRLDRGGHFLVEQAEVMNGDWEVTHMSLSFTGKELLFKNISIKSDEVFTDFRPAPATLSFARGVQLLKKQEAELAENKQP